MLACTDLNMIAVFSKNENISVHVGKHIRMHTYTCIYMHVTERVWGGYDE